MPFFNEINPAPGIRAGIWQITETPDELLSCIRLSHDEKMRYDSFRHELRKRQWLACRVLLQHMLGPVNTGISYDLNGKPFLDSGVSHVSLSHSGEFAVIACSENIAVGIDIEKMRDRVVRVKERFLRQDELDSISMAYQLEQLHVFWGGKEALYKLQGKPGLDFKNDIYIHPFDYLCNRKQHCNAILTNSELTANYRLYYEEIKGYMLVVAF